MPDKPEWWRVVALWVVILVFVFIVTPVCVMLEMVGVNTDRII